MRSVFSELSTTPARVKERRLSRRVQEVWRAKAVYALPAWQDFLRDDLGEDWRYCFTVDMRLSDVQPYFIYIGDALWRFSDLYLAGGKTWETALIDLAAAKMDEAALTKTPVGYAGKLRLAGGGRVLFRSVLLPLADNGVDVTHIFGAANGRGI